MKLFAQSLHPIKLQDNHNAGDLFEINKYSDRYHIVNGMRVPAKYFSPPFEVYEKEEIKTHRYSAKCNICKKTDLQTRFSLIGSDYAICYNCAVEKYSNNFLCSSCKYAGELEAFDNRLLCKSCKKQLVWKCKSCNENQFLYFKNQTVNEDGLNNSKTCMKCSAGECKLCSLQISNVVANNSGVCYAHHIKPFVSDKVNLSDRLVGIEIEMINSKVTPINSYFPRAWKRVHDGSLNEGGTEFVSPAFLGDHDLINQLNNIECAFEKSCSYVDDSCGLHVHVDTRDFSIDQLFNLYHVCLGIEEWIYSIVIPSRKSSKFSEPLDFNIEGNLEDTIYGSYVLDKSMIKRDKYQVPRYKWANFHSVFYRGTIEFRCHHAVTSADKIYNWVYFCQALVDYAKEGKPVGDGITILKAMSAKSVFVDYFRKRLREMQ